MTGAPTDATAGGVRPRRYRPTATLWATGALHAGVAAALAARPATWTAGLLLLLANHVALAALGVSPRSRALGPNLRRLPTADRTVALTFDDGPDPEVTPRVLELLAARGQRATFFCIGRRALAAPSLVADLAAQGHRVENHTHSHSNLFSFYPPRALRREIGAAQATLHRLAGTPPRYLRAPAGVRSPWLEPVLVSLGLHLASWTRRGYDTVTTEPDRIHRRLTADLAPGDVLVLHDRRRAAGGPPPVLEVLPRLLDVLEERGLRSIPLPDPGRAVVGVD
ncbi:MAG TPA: polysaccharide deacetylase family protein [Thermoanaerobaculia bacterium]|nr:polysaccharide deacetylase family protein [Thermoanaerobaculia bacterium]